MFLLVSKVLSFQKYQFFLLIFFNEDAISLTFFNSSIQHPTSILPKLIIHYPIPPNYHSNWINFLIKIAMTQIPYFQQFNYSEAYLSRIWKDLEAFTLQVIIVHLIWFIYFISMLDLAFSDLTYLRPKPNLLHDHHFHYQHRYIVLTSVVKPKLLNFSSGSTFSSLLWFWLWLHFQPYICHWTMYYIRSINDGINLDSINVYTCTPVCFVIDFVWVSALNTSTLKPSV